MKSCLFCSGWVTVFIKCRNVAARINLRAIRKVPLPEGEGLIKKRILLERPQAPLLSFLDFFSALFSFMVLVGFFFGFFLDVGVFTHDAHSSCDGLRRNLRDCLGCDPV